MKVQRLTRKQAKELLQKVPVDVLLTNENKRLTKKQKDYAYHLAVGETKAEAYRKAYKGGKANMNKKRDGNAGYTLSKHKGIAREVEAIKAGLAFQEAYSLGQIKALVIQRLTSEALNDENQGSTRVNALKTLGTVAGVDAFVHRTETRVIKDSDTLKAELMAKLKEAMKDDARTIDADAQALLAEIENQGSAPDTATHDETEEAGDPPPTDPLNSKIA